MNSKKIHEKQPPIKKKFTLSPNEFRKASIDSALVVSRIYREKMRAPANQRKRTYKLG